MYIFRLYIILTLCLSLNHAVVCGQSYSEPSVDEGSFRDDDGDGVYDGPSNIFGLWVQYTPSNPSDERQDRAVMEFDISAIPDGAEINSVALSFRIFSLITPTDSVDIVGYTGDGSAETQDAEVFASLLTSFVPELPGPQEFQVSPDFITDNLVNDFVGFRMQSGGGDVDLRVTPDTALLEIQFTSGCAFELGDVNMDNKVDLLDVAPFINLLTNSEFQCEADINEDMSVDLLDVSEFVAVLTGG